MEDSNPSNLNYLAEQTLNSNQNSEQQEFEQDLLKQIKIKRKSKRVVVTEEEKLCIAKMYQEQQKQPDYKSKGTLSVGSSPIINNLSPFVQSKSNQKLVLNSSGYMLPNAGLDSIDPKLSSDSMFMNPLVCGVADGVGQ